MGRLPPAYCQFIADNLRAGNDEATTLAALARKFGVILNKGHLDELLIWYRGKTPFLMLYPPQSKPPEAPRRTQIERATKPAAKRVGTGKVTPLPEESLLPYRRALAVSARALPASPAEPPIEPAVLAEAILKAWEEFTSKPYEAVAKALGEPLERVRAAIAQRGGVEALLIAAGEGEKKAGQVGRYFRKPEPAQLT